MTLSKRIFDVLLVLALCPIVLPILGLVLALLWITQGRPLFYTSERMKTPTEGFTLVKLRTMPVNTGDGGVTGGHKSAQLGWVHRLLRKSRLDEIPQLWNVLRGDMSFVGPRPPLRVYVKDYPAIYGPVLRNRPGMTGLASLEFHAHEERLLAQCTTAAETDAVYRRRCVPRKARLDLIYQRHASVGYDIKLLWQTLLRVLR